MKKSYLIGGTLYLKKKKINLKFIKIIKFNNYLD